MAEATAGWRMSLAGNIDHKNTWARACMLLQQNQYPWNSSAILWVRVVDPHTWIKSKWVAIYRCVGWILILFGSALSSVPRTFANVSVDDLIARTTIKSFSVSPDGRLVAFLTVQADPRHNIYHARLCLRSTAPSADLVTLAEYSLAPEEMYDLGGHFIFSAVSQYVWSADSASMLFTMRGTSGMELRTLDVNSGRQQTVLSGHQRLEIEDQLSARKGWTVNTIDVDNVDSASDLPKDFSLLMKDSYRFDYPLNNPRRGRPIVIETWQYEWGTLHATQIANTRRSQYWPYPDENKWTGRGLEITSEAPSPGRAPITYGPDLATSDKGALARRDAPDIATEFTPDKTTICVKKETSCKNLYEENALLLKHYSESTDRTRQSYLSNDGRLAILIRSTNLVPDELVALDVMTGQVWPIFSPNSEFRDKTRGITVRVIRIPVADGKLYGRLFLPSSYKNNRRYPLVITTYLSSPGFNVGSGELPVLALVTQGIAVFAMDARETNEIGRNKNFHTELARLERPLQGMTWVIEELSKEGVVDPRRVGLNGLSYGTEIAMYAYWRSRTFKTVSAATGSWEPMLYPMVGLGFADFLKDRGFADPKEDRAYEQWKRISVGLNARPTLPPLLLQSPDSERQWCVESWVRLRQAGAPVEWIEYPDEDHVKHNPADMWWVEQRNLDWFRFWLKDEEDPDSAKAEQYARWRELRKMQEGNEKKAAEEKSTDAAAQGVN